MPAHPKRTPEMVEAILEGMSKGQTLTSLCAAHGITRAAWGVWCAADEDLRIAHARAREEGHDAIAEDCLAIADDREDDPASRRVRTDVRLKLLAKWDPKRWGEKVDHTVTARTVSEVIAPDATPEQAADAYRRLIEG